MEFNSGKEAALFYAGNGLPVLPINLNDKRPLTSHGVKDATTDTDKILDWVDQYGSCNWAIATGQQSGVAVLDIDPRNGGVVSLEYLLKKFNQGQGLPKTPVVQTGGGGWHYYFIQPRSLAMKNRTIRPGLDIKTDGGYVILPPSETDKPYTWTKNRSWTDVPMAEMPGWIIEMASRGAQNFAYDDEGKVGHGQRNQYLTSLAGTMRRRGIHRDAILAALKVENEIKCSPPVSDMGELEHIADSVSSYEPEDPALKEHDDDLDIDVRMEALRSEEVIIGYLLGDYDPENVQTGYILNTCNEDQFLDQSHRLLFRAMKTLFLQSASINIENVRSELESKGDWGKDKIDVTFMEKLAKRGERIVYPADARFHTMKVLQSYMLREAAFIFAHGAQASKKGKEDPEELISHVNGRLMKLLDNGSEQQIFHTTESTQKVRQLIEAAKQGKLMLNERTGWKSVDDMLIGLPKGEITILAARPSQGKTAFAIQLANQMAMRWHEEDEPGQVLFFSAEMTDLQLMTRNASREAEVDGNKIKLGTMTDAEEKKVVKALADIDRKVDMWIDQTPAPSGQYMLAKALSLHKPDNPVRLVLVDFLELVGEEKGNREPNKVLRLEEALRRLKELAKQLNCVVVVLSQLGRQVESRATLDSPPIPRPSDLRWTGMAEQLANQILMLYYPWHFWNGGIPYKEKPDTESYEVHIPKNRDGKVGVIDMLFKRNYGKIVDPEFGAKDVDPQHHKDYGHAAQMDPEEDLPWD